MGYHQFDSSIFKSSTLVFDFCRSLNPENGFAMRVLVDLVNNGEKSYYVEKLGNIKYLRPEQTDSALSYSKVNEFKRFAFEIKEAEPHNEWEFIEYFCVKAQDLASKGKFRPKIVTKAIDLMLQRVVHNVVSQCDMYKSFNITGAEFLKYGLKKDLYSSSEIQKIQKSLSPGNTLESLAHKLINNYPEVLTKKLLTHAKGRI